MWKKNSDPKELKTLVVKASVKIANDFFVTFQEKV